jgi:predicted alpha/beta hydrolase family esterase
MVVAPEHEIISKFKTKISNLPEVEDYIKQARAKSDLERTDLAKEKTGIELKGIQAVNPVNNTEIPIFVADYVLAGYGTGAIMAVPAHDERDWEFAQKFNIPIKFVVAEDVKKTIVVIHGLTGHSRENWFPWLKELLTNCGYKVLIPDLPNSEQPVMTEWHAALDDLRNEIEGELIVVGHSLGAITACKYLESRNLPATKLILVAPTGKSEQAWKGIKVAGFGPEHVKVLNDFDNTEIDWRKLNSLVKEAYVYFSDNDPYIPSSIRDDYRELKATLRIFSGKGHFNESGGVTEFPEILLDILGLFAADGRAVNSEQFNNLSTAEVKEKIISWLEEKKIGRRAVNYKLRDWVFSRQRYWGEPIPVVHCENCQKKIFTQAVTINFYIQSVWERLLSGQKQVETRALNPEEPDRYFGQVKVGSYLRAVNKLTNEEAYFEVTQVWQYKNLAELFADKEVLRKVCAPKQLPDDLAKLEKGYSYAAGYVEKINTNGLMAWEVRRIAPGVVPVPEKDLPVTLPEVENYEPTGTGESPLAAITDWVNTTCPVCGGPAKRETNTMPQWAGSSWYYLRYIDPHNQEALVDQAKEKYWSPVDLYVGGAEHATRHLIYARFWHKFLYDSGVVSYEEPFTRLQHVGLIMAEDGRKMGKRWHNVINPDDVIAHMALIVCGFMKCLWDRLINLAPGVLMA